MREWLLRWLRVPPRPSLPAENPDDVRIFRAAPGWLNYRRLTWALKQGGALIGLIFGLYWLRVVDGFLPPSLSVGLGPIRLGPGMLRAIFVIVEASAFAGFAFQALGSLLLLRLDWDQRWYLVSDRSLRVREGLLRLHEKTTTFENIQNVTIRQGPLERLFGIADVEVQSAGGGGGDENSSKEDLHTVRFRGVADAAGIRDTILRRVEQARSGEPEPDALPADPLARLAAAAAALRSEARALAGRGDAMLRTAGPALAEPTT